MNRTLPLNCPSCGDNLIVKSLQCMHCKTQVNGLYNFPVLSTLSVSDQQFILEFVKKSGSLKEMSKTLNLSYPTVRNMLDELIERMKNAENQVNNIEKQII
jgi:hypothetical protein